MSEPIRLLVHPDHSDGAAATFDAVELDLVIQGVPGFVEDVRQEAQRRIDDSQRIESPGGLKKYSRILASLQQLHQWLT
ncbi:MAG: hypothetical protein QGH11_04015 [Pirellulaceae bacterium]|jgi:hypothetical protein|nr:hypothetical protein [Pirellulaceae bacterium]